MMPGHTGRVVALLTTPVLAFVAVVVFAPHGRSATMRIVLPAPSRPAWVVPRPVGLRAVRGASHVAPVRRAVLARASPNAQSRAVAPVATRTPEGTTNILELLGTARRERSGLWQRVRLAVLPNGRTGWVPRSSLGGSILLDTRLIVDRSRLRATLYRDGAEIFTAPVGIGQPAFPTPAGAFYVRDVLTRYASPSYGPIAFGTSARSATITDWPAGGYIGIHGTDEPDLIPGRISHGCIRLRNRDIRRLARLMPVGTRVIIR
jgi:lipoprotein-anchoring transpeptidase ErfK/SrfK